jgi:sugar phosphate isomerase/epimerase
MAQRNLILSRRSLLLSVPDAAALAATDGEAKVHVGSQLNAFRIIDLNTLMGALASVKQIGFEGFEAPYRTLESQFDRPEEMAKRLKDTGLTFFAIHIWLPSYDAQTQLAPWTLIQRVADGGAALGAQRLILSGGSTPDAASLARKAEALNRAGKYCREKGLQLAYHNHLPEVENDCAQLEGLLKATAPDLFHLVVDAGHAFSAGVDMAGFFSKHFPRIEGMHLRDALNKEEVPFGQGDRNWVPLAAAVRKSKWTGWLMTEEERLNGSKPGEAALRPAREGIRRIFGV